MNVEFDTFYDRTEKSGTSLDLNKGNQDTISRNFLDVTSDFFLKLPKEHQNQNTSVLRWKYSTLDSNLKKEIIHVINIFKFDTNSETYNDIIDPTHTYDGDWWYPVWIIITLSIVNELIDNLQNQAGNKSIFSLSLGHSMVIYSAYIIVMTVFLMYVAVNYIKNPVFFGILSQKYKLPSIVGYSMTWILFSIILDNLIFKNNISFLSRLLSFVMISSFGSIKYLSFRFNFTKVSPDSEVYNKYFVTLIFWSVTIAANFFCAVYNVWLRHF